MTSMLLDQCLASQRKAGFPKGKEDRRTVSCPSCDATGYNTGWGYWAFECGAEILSDGTVDKQCNEK